MVARILPVVALVAVVTFAAFSVAHVGADYVTGLYHGLSEAVSHATRH